MSMGNEMPHSEFLRDIQNWVWKRFPTRQLSATDIFYALKWADSSVPACIFIDGFENWLQSHPLEFVKDCRLSSLQFEAARIIAAYRKVHAADVSAAPVCVDDPYEMALRRITKCGRSTDNPLLRDALRAFYQRMTASRTCARTDYPDWKTRSESFYPLKARAILDWNCNLEVLLVHCFELLSEQEQSSLSQLTPAQLCHCMQIGEDAQKIYKKRILHQKLADYYHIQELLESL